MKIGPLGSLTLLLALGVPARAQDSPAPLPPVHLRFVNNPVGPDAPIHVYGGGAPKLALTVEAPLRSRVRIVADLFQLADGLAAPLRRDVSVTPELSFEDRTFLQTDCLLPALPAVRRRTTMLLKFRATAADSTANRSLTLIVYPHAEPGDWRKIFAARLARGGLRRVAVFGEGAGLRQFLRAHQVEFEDGGRDWPSEWDAKTLYLGETRAPDPFRAGDTPGVRLVLFKSPADDPLLPAGVYPSFPGIWTVTLSGLFAKPDEHPEAEAALDEIFRLTIETRFPATIAADPETSPAFPP